MVGFRERLLAGDLLAGTWVKTPHPHVVEVLSLTSLDVLVLDAEHAPFDRGSLDSCILAARAGGKPVLVRPPSAAAEHILNALDCGADGVILPHIRTAAAEVIVIAQIEDVEGVDNIDAIARVPGTDALFIGRADLTIAYGAETPDDAAVVDAVDRICAAGKAAGRTTGMFLGRVSDVPMWREKGASLLCGHRGIIDHCLFRVASEHAAANMDALHSPCSPTPNPSPRGRGI